MSTSERFPKARVVFASVIQSDREGTGRQLVPRESGAESLFWARVFPLCHLPQVFLPTCMKLASLQKQKSGHLSTICLLSSPTLG